MTNSTRIRAAAALLALPAMGMTIGVRTAVARLQLPNTPITPVPSRWVPFTADVTVTKPGSVVVGRFFRSSDGSRRLETGPTMDDPRVVFIFNAAEAQTYVYGKETGWVVRGIPDLTPGQNDPPTTLPSRPDISEYPYRLAIRRGESGVLDATTGFHAYQTTAPDGSIKLSVPELNFFDAVTRLATGRSEIYTNVVLIEPPAMLFHPPASANVVRQAARLPNQFR